MNELQEATTSFETKLFIALFFFLYLWFLIRRTQQSRVDISDFILMSTVAIIPTLFAFLPTLSLEFSHLLGVKFPFVILFGALIFFSFLITHRTLEKLSQQTQKVRQLTQKMALLEEELSKLKKS